jgi:hypothetical protein
MHNQLLKQIIKIKVKIKVKIRKDYYLWKNKIFN